MSSPAVELVDVTKDYEPLPRWMRLIAKSAARNSKRALDGVSLTVEHGTICAIVGPNGAGKSTLFRILMGLTTPTSGRATVLGRDCSNRSEAVGLPIGFMPADEHSLLQRLSCRENLEFQGQLRGLQGAALDRRVQEVLDQVGLGPVVDTAAFALSSGMKARLQLARAILHEPKVLVLDEPTAAIDPVAADDLLKLIKQLTAERSLAVLLSSHRLEEIDALDESVLLLDGGVVAFTGSLGKLRELAEGSTATVVFTSGPAAERAAARLRTVASMTEVTVDGDTVEIVCSEHLGRVMAALGPDVTELVHVHESSSSTRGILRSIYEAEPDEDPS